MFEDLEEESVDVTPDSPDRAIAFAIYSRGEAGNVTPEEAWAILHERYPDDPRFLLLVTYAELNETKKLEGGAKAAASLFTPAYFLKKVDRVLASNEAESLHPQLRDLVVFGGAVLAGVTGDEVAAVAELRAKIGIDTPGDPKRDERDRAGLKLRRYEREVVKELHERTQEGKSLGVARAPAPANSASDWTSAVADASKVRRKYAPDARVERGELVEHPKFGVGIVTGTEPGKAIILFESGTRKLVAGT